MQDFIQKAVGQFGLSETDAQGATGGLLSLVKENIDPSTFTELSGSIPGADDLVTKFQGMNVEKPSGLGSLSNMAGSLLGGKAKIASQAFGMLQNFNLDADKGKGFASLFGNYVKEKAGDSLFSKVTNSFPGIKGFL